MTSDGSAVELPKRVGHCAVEAVDASSILTRASGFMADYDFTLNPYAGCSFGCTYCYAAFFSRSAEQRDTWGDWVQVKRNALDKLRRMRTDLNGATVYMSSVTDPYQPVERHAEIVRALLPELADRGVRLVVQTRSGLVTRDIDLLARFDVVQVNMTVTTDSERIRRAFEPNCPTNPVRLKACRELVDAGIPTVITITPLLPLDDLDHFADELLATGVERYVVQPFHATRGKFVAGTGPKAREILREYGWTQRDYAAAVERLRALLPEVAEGREGFAPA
ncbi:MAG: radical SAM protein [Acidimicrobiales bacterium]